MFRSRVFLLTVIIIILIFIIIQDLGKENQCNESFDPQNKKQQSTTPPKKNTENDPYNDLTYDKKYNYDYDPNVGTQPESVIFDHVTKTIMTGSKFLKDTNLIPPPWVCPAWNLTMEEPDNNADDVWKTFDQYDNDPRMIYNRCSLSCCANQWPTSMNDEDDKITQIKKDKGEYLTSNYMCSNSEGRTGCICMTKNQIDMLYT